MEKRIVPKKSEIIALRCMQAENLSTKAPVLSKLAKHANRLVRQAVASNPNTPYVALRGLAKDECCQVRSHVAGNLCAPADIVSKLANDISRFVSRAAKRNLAARKTIRREPPQKWKEGSVKDFLKLDTADTIAIERKMATALPGYVPFIVCAAMRQKGTGRIIAGARHHDAVMNAQVAASEGREAWFGAEQGFIDQRGKFYTREEALVFALKNGQRRRRCGGDERALYSENLY